MGKKDKNEMAAQQAKFVEGAKKNGVKRKRRLHLRTRRQVRGLWLQQVPRRRLCARQLSYGLSESELPRGIPGGVHDARYGQYRQARDVCREARRSGIIVNHRASTRQASTSWPNCSTRLGPAEGETKAQAERGDPIFARGAEKHRQRRRRDTRCRARGTAPTRTSTISRAVSRPKALNKRASKRWRPPVRSMHCSPTARLSLATSIRSRRLASRFRRMPKSDRAVCSAAAGERRAARAC